jgi:hypothetical protein
MGSCEIAASASSSLKPPRRPLLPTAHRARRPRRRLVLVAGGARIRNAVLVGHRGRDEREGVRSHFYVANLRLNFRHVALDAAATR